MTLDSTGSLLADARAERRAVAAFNVITLEHAEGIVAGAERAGRHVEDAALLHEAASAGFSSVMFDASHASYGENVEFTRRAAE